MRRLVERIRESPTGDPDPARDVSSLDDEEDALRKSIKQLKDSAWNLRKAQDNTSDEDRRQAYGDAAEIADKARTDLVPLFQEIAGERISPRARRELQQNPSRYARADSVEEQEFGHPKC